MVISPEKPKYAHSNIYRIEFLCHEKHFSTQVALPMERPQNQKLAPDDMIAARRLGKLRLQLRMGDFQ